MTEYATPYQALGEAGIRRLVDAFYDIMDEHAGATHIRAMHARDLAPMKEKLGDYLVGWMGGPPVYASRHGSVCMTTPHEPYAIGPRERDEWLLCMEQALERIEAEASVKDMLKEPLFRIADAVRNKEVSGTADDPNVIAVG